MTRDDDSPAVVIPRAVFWGLILPLIGGICGGSWYAAQLSVTVANQGTNQATMTLHIAALESKVDANKDLESAKAGDVSNRLARMEAQLSFLVKTSEGPSKK